MRARVVLADDEPYILRGLRKLLDWASLDLEVVGEASDGEQLVELLNLHRPELLLSDIGMPRKTGLEVLKLISLSGLPTKVIFFSGHKEFDFAREAVAYGAVDYLLKPIHTDELVRAIGRALGPGTPAAGPEAEPGPGAPLRSPLERQIALWKAGEPGASYQALALGWEGGDNPGTLLRFAALNLIKRLVPGGGRASAWDVDGLFLVAALAADVPVLKVRLAGSLLAELGRPVRCAEGPAVDRPEDFAVSAEGALEALAAQTLHEVPSGPEAVQRVLDHIGGHFAEPLSLEDAASVACMNPSYFSAWFKRHTGKNFKDYLSGVRIEASVTLLLRSDLKVYEVAAAVGFKDPKVYAEVFRRFHQVNPAEYKSQILKNLP